MLLVFAHEADKQARTLVERWRAYGARLMTVQDLSLPGWCHGDCMGEPSLVAEGEQVPLANVRGIFSRIRSVTEADLAHIAEDDRSYVVSEMMAFIVDWLWRAPCPVLNRPTVGSPIGAAFSYEHWLALASGIGLRLAFMHKAYPSPSGKEWPSVVPVTVVGDRWFGDVDETLGNQAVKLARAVPIDLLTVVFDRVDETASFISADPMINVDDVQVAAALLERFGVEAPS